MVADSWRIEDVEFAIDELAREFPAIDNDDLVAVTLQASAELDPHAGPGALLGCARQTISRRQAPWYGLERLRASGHAPREFVATAGR